MTEAKELTVVEQQEDLSLEVFGKRSDIDKLAKRIQVMLPGGDKLTTEQCYSLAQYSILTGANPFRGEIYAIPLEVDKQTGKATKIALDDGYKLLIRWAKSKCEYSEWYEPLTQGINEGDIGFTCYILRQDKQELLNTFLKGGMALDRAMDICTVSAVGVVRYGESHYRYDGKWHKKGDPMDPPTGWTWEQVAKKRALKNALNLSHGAPSLAEIARESWNVQGVQTQPEDWQDVHSQMLPAEAEATAAYNARLREMHEREPTVETAAEAADELFGEGATAAFSEGEFESIDEAAEGLEAEPQEPPDPTSQERQNGDRPYDPETIKVKLAAIVEGGSGEPATDDQRGLVGTKIEECFAGDADSVGKALDVLQYLFDSSLSELTQAHVDALKRWLLASQEPDDTGDYPLHDAASGEALAIVEAMDDDGVEQGELPF
jgi:hypothetical protein